MQLALLCLWMYVIAFPGHGELWRVKWATSLSLTIRVYVHLFTIVASQICEIL